MSPTCRGNVFQGLHIMFTLWKMVATLAKLWRFLSLSSDIHLPVLSIPPLPSNPYSPASTLQPPPPLSPLLSNPYSPALTLQPLLSSLRSPAPPSSLHFSPTCSQRRWVEFDPPERLLRLPHLVARVFIGRSGAVNTELHGRARRGTSSVNMARLAAKQVISKSQSPPYPTCECGW